MFLFVKAGKDNNMNKIFISIWKIDIDQDYFDVRLILLPEKGSEKVLFELKGNSKDLDGNDLNIKEFAIHRSISLFMVTRYVLQQINSKFAFNKDIDAGGDGMREWISPMDSGDRRLFIRSLFDSKIRNRFYN